MTFVLFGSTGDLAKRKIYPALYNLFIQKKMPSSFSVIGLGRSEKSHHDFQKNIEQSIIEFSRHISNDRSETDKFLKAFRYCQFDANNKEDYKKLLQLVKEREEELHIPENRMFYLSVAPKFFDVIALNILESGLGSTAGWKRLIIEKPFGHDLESARQLNAKLSEVFNEEEIFRIDHYLGKPMVQKLKTIEFAHPVVQALWNNKFIANVQITASETLGVEGRVGFYDQAGAIRDMFQNHLLQVLMMTAVHMPLQNRSNDIHEEKRKIIESLRPLMKEEVGLHVVRGQYTAGHIHEEPVVGYLDEPGIDESSQNDTFIAARLRLDHSLWSGVPFYIRTGKRMAEKSTRIVVEFKDPLKDQSKNVDERNVPNLLIIEVNPQEGIFLQLNNGKLNPIKLDYSTDQEDVPEAYELLINDALRGDSTYFAHWNEVELAWKWVQPALDAFEEKLVPLHPYASGSNGPDAAQLLLQEDGNKWWMDKEAIEEELITQA